MVINTVCMKTMMKNSDRKAIKRNFTQFEIEVLVGRRIYCLVDTVWAYKRDKELKMAFFGERTE